MKGKKWTEAEEKITGKIRTKGQGRIRDSEKFEKMERKETEIEVEMELKRRDGRVNNRVNGKRRDGETFDE